jgi:GTP pyrophosphokinase
VLQQLITKIKSYHSNCDENLIRKAYIFSKEAHGNQKRHSGDLYFSHPVAVAEIVIDLKLDEASIVTALLHDVVEDTEISLEDIEKEFGEQIAKLVDGVTKLGKIESISSNERVAENFRKLTLAMSEDIRVLLIKLADRLHNMRTLNYVPSAAKRIKKAKESLDIYAPLAARIGLNKIKDELQELSFAIIDPDSRSYIIERVSDLREKKKDLIEAIIAELNQILELEKIDFKISGRQKTPYSIWLKMKNDNIGFHSLNDIIAFRVIVKNIAECYRVFGVFNSHYSMIPGSFKDYISTPKENGYRSLHLVTLGPFNKKIEIQIRDHEMHELAELGIAAHWRYKQSDQKISDKKSKNENEQYRWIRELISLFENSETASEVLKNHKLQIHKDEVFCFTPNGDIFNLPNGSTVLDFAYYVHSEVGNSCVSAKINGIICSLRQKLENGDQVEIITSKSAKPSPNWLQFVTTYKAKHTIKLFIRNQKFDEYKALGMAILNKFFTSKGQEFNTKIIEKTLSFFKQKTVDDLFVKIADGSISRQDVFKNSYPDFKEEIKSKQEKTIKSRHSIPIDGLVDGMAVRYAGCCNPIPGDSIIGVINTGVGVTIHSQTCHNLKNLLLNPQRILDVCWKEEKENDELFPSRISVVVSNQSGSLAEVTSIIAKKKININNVITANRSFDYLEFIIDVSVKNVDDLENILSSIRLSKKVIEVTRS